MVQLAEKKVDSSNSQRAKIPLPFYHNSPPRQTPPGMVWKIFHIAINNSTSTSIRPKLNRRNVGTKGCTLGW